MEPTSPAPQALICCSHLRWNFVFQRPHHLMSRFASRLRVYYLEEPLWVRRGRTGLRFEEHEGVTVITPVLTQEHFHDASRVMHNMLTTVLAPELEGNPILWYQTPLALEYSRGWSAGLVVYDCMDELNNFLGADPRLPSYEEELFATADLVFTGGHSLYEAKRHRHPNVYAFPSGIDEAHFARALTPGHEPADQKEIRGPKIGFFGVIDERFDIGLMSYLAAHRPQWQFMLIGPVVKIPSTSLPQAGNLHYLGKKSYAELPDYLGHWDAAILPFAINDATRYISPTKTPEYLAGGRKVVSTAITDVVHDYGADGLVEVAYTPQEFVAALEKVMASPPDDTWRTRVRAALVERSWEHTAHSMLALMLPSKERQNAPELLTQKAG